MNYRTTRRLCILAAVFCILPPFVKEWKSEHQLSLDNQLYVAIDDSDPDAVVEVLNQGADVNTTQGTFYDTLPLVVAIQKTIPVSFNNLQMDVAGEVSSSSTVTQSFPPPADNARLEIVRCLLERGADANKPDNKGNFPLLVARQARDDLGMLKLLLAHGAKVNVKGRDGHTALWFAQQHHNPELIHLLKQAGAKE